MENPTFRTLDHKALPPERPVEIASLDKAKQHFLEAITPPPDISERWKQDFEREAVDFIRGSSGEKYSKQAIVDQIRWQWFGGDLPDTMAMQYSELGEVMLTLRPDIDDSYLVNFVRYNLRYLK
jgi:hypothetical protein